MSRGTVVLIDDDADLLDSARDWLDSNGFSVHPFRQPRQAVNAISALAPDVVVTDMRMPQMGGREVLAQVCEQHRDIPVVLLTGYGDVTMAVEAIKAGAEDFLEKPYNADHLIAVLDKAIEKRRVNQEVVRLQRLVHEGTPQLPSLLGEHATMVRLRNQIAALAPLDIDVLIVGETGTGKELVARSLHEQSQRAQGPFVALNCAAIPEAMFESEVFGHVRGAFTGADRERVGKLEHAAGGTVFLDEIESMPVPLQVRILRALQERVIERLGENKSRQLDVRIVAAAKTDLKALIEAREFREDLYFRLAGVQLMIPPLRERGNDIVSLYGHFKAMAAKRYGLTLAPTSAERLRSLLLARWPGNVRELKALAERDALGLDWSDTDAAAGVAQPQALSLPEMTVAFERDLIVQTLASANGNASEAARRLKIPRRTLGEKMQRYGIS